MSLATDSQVASKTTSEVITSFWDEEKRGVKGV